MKIKWTNTVSKESGFVKRVDTKGRYFESTTDEMEAKVYMSVSTAKGIITKLESFGEGTDKNNVLEVVA